MSRNILTAVALAAITFTPACAQEGSKTELNKSDIEEIVRDYIMDNPVIVEEALYKLAAIRQEEESKRIADALASNSDALINAKGDFSIGPDNAPVTVVEFFDYRCGYCKTTSEWASKLPASFENKVRVVFKDFPILSPESETAAMAALAAGRQGKYIEMHLGLMELDNKTGFKDSDIDGVAESVGVDVAKMRADMQSVEIRKTVADTKSLARALGISGTPNFIIGTDIIPAADTDAVEASIKQALEDV